MMANTMAATDLNWHSQQRIMVNMAMFSTESAPRLIQSSRVSVCLCVCSISNTPPTHPLQKNKPHDFFWRKITQRKLFFPKKIALKRD